MLCDETLDRAAIGRIATVGALYDARTDRFCGITMLKRRPHESSVRFVDCHNSKNEVIIEETFSEKFKTLDINAELKVSLLGGLFELEGSGRYFAEKKTNTKTLRGTVLYNITTQIERLELFNEDLKECISLAALSHEKATHVVVEIQWGANCCLTVKQINTESSDGNEVGLQGHLRPVRATLLDRCLKMLAAVTKSVDVEGGVDVDFENIKKEVHNSFAFKLCADVISGQVVTNFEDAIKVAKNLPNLVKESNGGKGVPVKYVMFPLQAKAWKEHIGISQRVHTLVLKLDECAIMRVVDLFDQISSHRQQIGDIIDEMTQYIYCLGQDKLDTVKKFSMNLEVSEISLRQVLAKTVQEMRCGKVGATEFEKLYSKYLKSDGSSEKLLMKCASLAKEFRSKIDFAKLCAKYKIIYICTEADLAMLIMDNDSVFALFGSEKLRTTQLNFWKKNQEAFLIMVREQQRNKKTIFTFVDCDFDDNLAQTDKIKISHFVRGRCLCEDYAEKQVTLFSQDIAQTDNGVMEFITKCPEKMHPVKFRCPGSLIGSCDGKEREWLCERCHKQWQIAADAYFYCDCGRAKADKIMCRCSSEGHGSVPMSIPSEILRYLLTPLTKLCPTVKLSLRGDKPVAAICYVNSQLFVARFLSKKINVYDTSTFAFQHNITASVSSGHLWGLAACTTNNCLYVADTFCDAVFRMNLTMTDLKSAIKWSVARDPYGLSVTSSRSLLVACFYVKKIQEYDTNGSLIREISDNNFLYHAIELSGGAVVVSQQGPVHGVTLKTVDGRDIKTYGSITQGSGPGQMNNPRSLAVDREGFFVVADTFSNRLVVLDPEMTEARQLPLSCDFELKRPVKLCYDGSLGQLYVGECARSGRLLVFSNVFNLSSLFSEKVNAL